MMDCGSWMMTQDSRNLPEVNLIHARDHALKPREFAEIRVSTEAGGLPATPRPNPCPSVLIRG